MTVYNIIIHLPPSHSNDKSPKVRVADSFVSEQMAKDALFDLVVSDFEAAQKEGTDLINKRSFSLQKMLVHVEDRPPQVSVEPPKEPEYAFNPALFRNVEELELSVRSASCLSSEDIVLIGHLVQRTEAQLLRVPNFGRKSLNEIRESLATMGLHFGMDVRGFPRTAHTGWESQ
jgi:DNA-directed RNA polymerase alpha subunit